MLRATFSCCVEFNFQEIFFSSLTAYRRTKREAMEKSLKLLFIACLMSVVKANVRVEIDFIKATNEVKKLPRFWTNTGFAPPEPVDKAADFFETDDVKRNLEIIGSLPNQGIRNVRIHWLLNLLSIR